MGVCAANAGRANQHSHERDGEYRLRRRNYHPVGAQTCGEQPGRGREGEHFFYVMHKPCGEQCHRSDSGSIWLDRHNEIYRSPEEGTLNSVSNFRGPVQFDQGASNFDRSDVELDIVAVDCYQDAGVLCAGRGEVVPQSGEQHVVASLDLRDVPLGGV